ncbi:MAG: hypothetical protein ACLFTJ_00250 [Halothece sp.]
MSQLKTDTHQKRKQEKLQKFKQSLNTSRALQKTRLSSGVNGIDHFVEDVESDWLETWRET